MAEKWNKGRRLAVMVDFNAAKNPDLTLRYDYTGTGGGRRSGGPRRINQAAIPGRRRRRRRRGGRMWIKLNNRQKSHFAESFSIQAAATTTTTTLDGGYGIGCDYNRHWSTNQRSPPSPPENWLCRFLLYRSVRRTSVVRVCARVFWQRNEWWRCETKRYSDR